MGKSVAVSGEEGNAIVICSVLCPFSLNYKERLMIIDE